MNDPVLFCYAFEPDGGVYRVDASVAVHDHTPTWVHLDSGHVGARAWLSQHLALEEHMLDALLDEETRPRVIKADDAALMLLRGVNLNANANPEDMVTLRIFANAQRIITLRGRRLKAASDVESELLSTQQPIDSASVLCRLINSLLDRMSPVLESLDDRLDSAEEQVIEHADSELRVEINNIRKQAILFRRYIAPQRDAIYQIKNLGLDWLSDDDHEHLIESHNHVQRYVEDLDAIRERAQIVKDELANIISDRMNRNTFLLTVVAAIFLPISFLTGLLGVNVGGIPGADSEQAFWVFVGMLALVVGIQLALFKKMKWF